MSNKVGTAQPHQQVVASNDEHITGIPMCTLHSFNSPHQRTKTHHNRFYFKTSSSKFDNPRSLFPAYVIRSVSHSPLTALPWWNPKSESITTVDPKSERGKNLSLPLVLSTGNVDGGVATSMEVLPLLSRWLDSNCEVVSCKVCVAIYEEEAHGGDSAIRVRRSTRDLGFPLAVVRDWLERTLFLRFWLGFYFLQVAMDSGVVVRRWAKGFWWRYWAIVSAFDWHPRSLDENEGAMVAAFNGVYVRDRVLVARSRQAPMEV